MPFNSPNYTQAPNEFFDNVMRDLGYAELKVVLAVIRLTFGFHRETAKASLTTICKMTGLNRQAVMSGAKLAEERGIIEKNYDEKGRLLWSVCLSYQDGMTVIPPYIVLKKQERKGANAPSDETRYDGYVQ